MGVVYVCTYKDGGEAEAIRDWCRDEIEKLKIERSSVYEKGSPNKGSGSKQRLIDITTLDGRIYALRTLLNTKFVSENEVDLILATK